jgi:UvrD-like helicase family protein
MDGRCRRVSPVSMRPSERPLTELDHGSGTAHARPSATIRSRAFDRPSRLEMDSSPLPIASMAGSAITATSPVRVETSSTWRPGTVTVPSENKWDLVLDELEQLEQIAGTYPTRSSFLTEVTLDSPEATSAEAVPPHLDEDYLVLSTIHSAKGQEWEAVFVLNVIDGCMPSDMAVGSGEQIEEERRLLYGSLRESDAERGKEIANTIEAGLSIYIEPVILRDVEGTKDFTILCGALLKILVKRLFPAGRVQVCGIRDYTVHVEQNSVIPVTSDHIFTLGSPHDRSPASNDCPYQTGNQPLQVFLSESRRRRSMVDRRVVKPLRQTLQGLDCVRLNDTVADPFSC